MYEPSNHLLVRIFPDRNTKVLAFDNEHANILSVTIGTIREQ